MASYREELEAWAAAVGSDGCTGVPDFFRICCLEHDHAYLTGTTFRGRTVTNAGADRRFRDCIQAHSSFRLFSPMSWWRWLAVRWFGRGIWDLPADQLHDTLYAAAGPLRDAALARRRILRELFAVQE